MIQVRIRLQTLPVLLICRQPAHIIRVHDEIRQSIFILKLGIGFIYFIHKLHLPAEIIGFIPKKAQRAIRFRILLQQVPADEPFRWLNALQA